MENTQYFKLNEIVLGLEKVLERYTYYFNKFLLDNSKLIETPIGQEIMKVIQDGAKKDSNSPISKILQCLNVNNNDLMLNYNLDEFQTLVENNRDSFEIFNDSTLKTMSDFADEYKWVSQCLLVNIDTYINMFFKLMYDIEFDKNIPKGFNDQPQGKFYETFPILINKLDYEFKCYNELHAIRNNIVHNGMIVDQKLLDKLSIQNGLFNNGISMFLPNFDKVILYTLSCLEIVLVTNTEVLKNTYLMEQITKRKIYQDLEKYHTYKDKYINKNL